MIYHNKRYLMESVCLRHHSGEGRLENFMRIEGLTVSERLAYWNHLDGASFGVAKEVFKVPLARCIELAPADLGQINARVFDIVARSWKDDPRKIDGIDTQTEAGRRQLLDALNATTRFSIDVKGNLDRFVQLEVELLNVFVRLGLLQGIVGWQFPVDIRVVHPRPPESYLKRRDATDYMHCDPWRGEPADLVNVVMYCEVSDQASQLELYSVTPAELPRFEAYDGDEKESAFLLGGRPPIQFDHRSGQIILFDGYLPHRTRRLGDSVRISLNFSLRRLNPYAVIDDRWNRERQAWHKFWFMNEARVQTFTDRYQEELKKIAVGESAAALAARSSALLAHFGVKV
jgi:hypothetical protein